MKNRAQCQRLIPEYSPINVFTELSNPSIPFSLPTPHLIQPCHQTTPANFNHRLPVQNLVKNQNLVVCPQINYHRIETCKLKCQ